MQSPTQQQKTQVIVIVIVKVIVTVIVIVMVIVVIVVVVVVVIAIVIVVVVEIAIVIVVVVEIATVTGLSVYGHRSSARSHDNTSAASILQQAAAWKASLELLEALSRVHQKRFLAV